MNKNQSKYFYTASLMNQALLALLEKHDIDFISITEITKKAGVSRSTFYLHYDDIYDLLEETIENSNKEFMKHFQGKTNIDIESIGNAFLITEEYLKPYLEFCKQNKRLFKVAHKRPDLFQNKHTYRKMYDKIFYPAISQFVENENQRIYNLEFFTQGVVAIINKWIELDCVTEIDEIIKIIKKCVGY